MLAKSTITTMLPVGVVARAARFYGEILGLHERVGVNGTRVFETGFGAAIALRSSENGNRPTGHTVLRFAVEDIQREVAELTARGVRFEDYDLPELTTVGHIANLGAEKVAWFSDTEGNVLCIHEVLV